jgi:hypothetical protein
MNDPAGLAALSASGLLAIGLASVVGLKGWTGWLDVRRLELAGRGAGRGGSSRRLEIAALRERVRRLEAIANGAEL